MIASFPPGPASGIARRSGLAYRKWINEHKYIEEIH